MRGDLGDGGGAVALEPGGGLLPGDDAAGQGDLEGPLPQAHAGRLGDARAGAGEVLFEDAVGAVGVPVELLLGGDHLLAGGLGALVGLVQELGAGCLFGQDGGGLGGGVLDGQAVEELAVLDEMLGEVGGGEGEVLEGGAGELVSWLPGFVTDSATNAPVAFIVAVLLEPEEGGGGVEHAEQVEVLLLGGSLRQLDDRSGPIEDLPTPVEHEMIVSRHKSESNKSRRTKAHLIGENIRAPMNPSLQLRFPES